MRADAGVVTRAASDQRLVEQVRAGSHPAFETLFYRHHQGVLAFCARMLGSQVEAEDAAQQTFLAAYRDLARAGQPVEFRPWLYGIARHRCLMALRHRRERPIGVVGDPGGSYDLTAEVGVRADMRALLPDVARLPEEQRRAGARRARRLLARGDRARPWVPAHEDQGARLPGACVTQRSA